MEQSPEIDALATALAAAAAELREVEHDAKNPHLRNRYATLAAVLSTSRPILQAHGLALTQWLGGTIAEGHAVDVTTQLTHSSGQWMRSTVGAVVERGKGISLAQSGGGQISYLRRYAALAALGLASADDVDGHVDPPPPQPAPPPPPRRWSDVERKAFCATLTGWGLAYDALAAWCEAKGRPRPSAMTAEQRAKLLAYLEPMDADSRLALVGVTP